MRTDLYWSKNGKHETLITQLYELVPASGEVPNKRKNKALEKFRKASNCYYDLYNNGLCNRTKEFYNTFNVASSKYKKMDKAGYYTDFTDELFDIVENKMDEIILAAAKEQNIT